MSPLGKLFAAALIIATGFGVATLLGKPSALTQALSPAGTSVQPTIEIPPLTDAVAIGAYASTNVQLLPETTANNSAAIEMQSPANQTPLVPLSSAQSAVCSSCGNSQFSNSVAVVESAASANYGGLAPRAKLRNEAPRPIGNEPRSPATIRRSPTVEMEQRETVTTTDPYAVAQSWPAPQLLPVGYTSGGQPTAAATTASYDELVRPADGGDVAPPPWPSLEETDGARTHIIVDGDSLARLAGRYLGDPRRSAEIYELNRELLANPDLLPIGTELRIPERSAQASWGRQGKRMGAASDATVREAAYGNLVPVRPISPYQNIVPRAQLARPLPIE